MKITFFGSMIFLVFTSSNAFANLQTSGQDELATYIKNAGVKNDIIKPASGVLKYDYLVPSGPYFQLFDWDMYFMGLALSYDGISAPVASSVKDFLLFVDSNANEPGYAPRIITPSGPWALPQQCKPFMAQAAVRASQTSGDFEWIREEFGSLKLMLQYWENSRRASDGLFLWFNAVESGADNNPAVSDLPTETTEGVDLQVYIYREYLALAAIAEKLGQPAEATSFRKKASDLAALVNSKMWSTKDSSFYNIDSRSGKQIKVKSWTNFTPLWAHIPNVNQAKAMIEQHVLSKAEFWSPHGVRTLAATEKLYDAVAGYWRGPVWVISNYIVMHGLMNYGYKSEAIELANKTVDLLVNDFKTNGSMNECYNPEMGDSTASDHFVSWNLLAEHMVEEAQTGQDPAAL